MEMLTECSEIYPCNECIVKGNCSDICDKVSDHKIFNSTLKTGSCPDCGDTEIYLHEITKVFWITSCCTCRSRLTMHFRHKTLIINRSVTPKGGTSIFNGKALPFTTTTYSTFIEVMKRMGWGREGYGFY
jgi:hypothetical protein